MDPLVIFDLVRNFFAGVGVGATVWFIVEEFRFMRDRRRLEREIKEVHRRIMEKLEGM